MGSFSAYLIGGVTGASPFGTKSNIAFAGTWAVGIVWSAGDRWYVKLVTTVGDVQLGYAVDASGQAILVGTNPTFGLTFGGRLYLANGTKFTFSDNGDPTGWYEQNPGAGFVSLLQNYGGQDSVTALAPYQGRLAVFLRNSIQIWKTDADPANFVLVQPLPNVGTAYGFSVQSLGDWDVLFLADSGVRSLRVRDSSLNATTTDIGSPVDKIIQTVLAAGNVGTPISVVEPTTNRYWLYLKNTIYVLSYFADGQIRAWSTYKPTYDALTTQTPTNGVYSGLELTSIYKWTPGTGAVLTCGEAIIPAGYFYPTATTATVTGGTGTLALLSQVAFVPSKFIVYEGRVYARGNNGTNDLLLLYGGSYDTSIATVQSPFLSLRSPSTNKKAVGCDLAVSGSWALSLSMDQASGTSTFENVANLVAPTYDGGIVGLSTDGTHVAFKMVSSDTAATAAVLSNFNLIYNPGEIA